MKIYKFYKIYTPSSYDEELITKDLSTRDKNPLYAVTTNKKFAKQFKKERDMNLFKLIVTDLDKDDAISFMNKNNGAVINNYSYETFIDPYGKKEVVRVKIISTWTERETVSMIIDEGISETKGDIEYLSPMMFKKKFIKALEKLEYVNSWKVMSSHTSDDIVDLETFGLFDKDLDYAAPSFTIDEVTLFTMMYKELFK